MIYRLAIFLTLAEAPEPPKLDAATVYVMGGIIGILTIVALLLTVVHLWRAVFGRTPSLESDLKGKVDAKDLENLKVLLGGFATTVSLSSLESELHNRTKGLEQQVVNLRHDIKDEATNRTTAYSDIVETTTELGQQLARLDERSQGVALTVNNFDRKLDRLFEGRGPAKS